VTTIALLGTGTMGAPMARNLVKAGFDVRVWNRTAAKAAPLADAGCTVARSVAEAADGADVLLTMLHDADAVAAVAPDALPALAKGAVWLQMSTVGLEGSERLGAVADEQGVPYVEAPVLGTRQPAESGQLTVLASALEDLRARVAPVLDAVGARTVWFDRRGDSMRAKLVMNSWTLAVTEAAAEAVALAEAFGLDPMLLPTTVAGGPLDNAYLQTKTAMMRDRSFPTAFPLRGAAKDAALIAAAGRSVGVDMAVAEAVARRMGHAVELGHGDEDMAATYLGQRPG
jgi:3-hydroxyisobutyrate dehydrogenase